MSLLGTTFALVAALASPADTVLHPLDPLTAAEIVAAREALTAAGKLTAQIRFASLTLREPLKEAVFEQLSSGRFRRTAEALLYDWATSTPVRAQVDLELRKLIAWDTLPSREPPTRNLIRRRLEEIVRPDPRWQHALLRRGIRDPGLVTILPRLGESEQPSWRNGDRVVRAAGYDQELLSYAAVLAGIGLEVNLSKGSILVLSDTATDKQIAASLSRHREAAIATAKHPVSIRSARDGLQLRGSEVSWQNWRLHFGLHPRRGLELWDISWMEGNKKRPILYRASVSEAMAAYGDPRYPVWYPRDAGNAGLGDYQGNSAVELGDAPAGATFADAVFADDFGRPRLLPRAAAIYERDGGLLWRHAGSARRARQLVVSSHSTIDNYDFVFNWIFGEDGGIDVEVNLTGTILIYRDPGDAARTDAHGGFAHRVAPGLAAPNHQHFFSFRLDFDVDGATPNRVLESESVRVPQGRANPDGLWFAMRDSPLVSEAKAQRNLHTAASRKWRVINPAERNSLGDPVGYTLIPGEVAIPYASPRSTARRAGGFVGAQLWVTPYRRDEMYAAGEYVNFNLPNQGLPTWTGANRNLLDTDVVLWYTLGVTHIPRPEDYPVMPVHRAAFRLVPTGFFAQNPALERP